MSDEERIAALMARYGEGSDGSAPTAAQWRRLLALPRDTPVSLVNLFALRGEAHYAEGPPADGAAASGGEALARYAAVSGPALEKVGGTFLLTGPATGALLGNETDAPWDVVAVGRYPNGEAVLALFEDEAYAAAWVHRRAAMARQQVVMVAG